MHRFHDLGLEDPDELRATQDRLKLSLLIINPDDVGICPLPAPNPPNRNGSGSYTPEPESPEPETPTRAASPDEVQILSKSRRSYPLIRAIFAQLTAAAVVIGGHQILGSRIDLILPLPALLVLQGLIAAGLGQVLGLAKWWLLINFLIPTAVVLALSFNLPAWVYPLLFIGLALVFWNSADDRVPLYLTNRTTWRSLQTLVAAEARLQQKPLTVTDIGCGLGGALLYLARHCPDTKFVGIESAPLPYAIARLRVAVSGLSNLSIRYGDLWKQNLGAFDLIYCFLSPEPMPRLYKKAKSEMSPGKLLISNSFSVPGVASDDVVRVDDRRETELLLYRI